MKSKQELLKLNKDLQEKEYLWKAEKNILERKNKLAAERAEVMNKRMEIHISTSKLLILFLFLSCTIIEIFTGYVTIRTLSICEQNLLMFDFTPLVTLIGAVVGEVIGYAVYSLKATKENTKGGITYETTMNNLSTNDEAVG